MLAANDYAKEHVDPQAQKAILSGEFTREDIETWRQSLGLNWGRFSNLIGYSEQQARNVEHGQVTPSLKYLKAVRDAARRLEHGLFNNPVPDRYGQYQSYAYIPRSEIARAGMELRKCANPDCDRMRYMGKRRRFCSETCRLHTYRQGLTDASYQNEPQGVPRRYTAGPIIATCPHCGQQFPTKGNSERDSPYARNGGRAHVEEG